MRALSFLLVGMFLILFTLQLCGVIAWSWWLVAAPLLAWVGIPLTCFGFCIFCMGFFETMERLNEEMKKERRR